MVSAATPADSVPVPNWVAGVVVLSRKVTIPVGVPIAGAVAVTVAVKVTDWPNTDGLGLEASPTVAPPWLMTWVRAVDVTGSKLLSPE